MLFYTKNDVDLFDKNAGGKLTRSGYMYVNDSSSELTKDFPSGVREFWFSIKAYDYSSGDPLKIFIPVVFKDGHTGTICFRSSKSVYLPTGDGSNQVETKFTKNTPGQNTWYTCRLHCWIDKEDSTKLYFSAYINGKPLVEGLTSVAQKNAEFSYFKNLSFRYDSYLNQYEFTDVIISDKFFGESAKIKTVPITQIKNWIKNPDTGQYYANKINQQGTLVTDSLLLADLEKYNIVSVAFSGKVTREGDNIKNLEVTVGDNKINSNIYYGVTPLCVEVGNDLTLLPNITIETKG